MRTQRQDRRRAVAELASKQQGYFTAAQALEVGCSYPNQKFHVDHGNWIKVERGIFRLREWPSSDDDHFVRAYLWSRTAGVISHQSALVAHDLGVVNPPVVHMSVPPGFRRTSDLIVLHRQAVPEGQSEDRGVYKVTTPARALAECAADQLPQELLDDAVADALRLGKTTRRRLLDASAGLGPTAQLGIERALRADAE